MKNAVITPEDIYYMNLALAEAKKGQYITRPNPSVGCILVSNDNIIGRGHTSPAGGHHGEINALNNARELNNEARIKKSTAYVTLEPCSHYGRTPPCAKRLVEEGIDKVVIAGLDPNPKVAGRGISILQQAGIEVCSFTEGSFIHQQAESINRGFLKTMRTGLPYVRLKVAISLDGRTAMRSGESKWITSTESREDVQSYRALSGAIITGSQTIIDDNPSLNVRSPYLGVELNQIPQPRAIILDRRNRLSHESNFTICQNQNTIFWRDSNLLTLLHTLSTDYQCHDILVEAGANVAGAFIKEGLVDELIVYQAPCLLGTNSRSMFDFEINKLSEQHRLRLVSHETIGHDLKLIFQK